MLHILLLILKIIGIIVAVILGILILLAGIVLFAPIRYEISAKCSGTIDTLKAKVKATWLLHLMHADVFLKGKKIKWQVRLAWFKRSNQRKTDAVGEIEREEEKKEEKKNEAKENESEKVEEAVVEDDICEKSFEVSEEKCQGSSKTNETYSEEDKKQSVSDKIKGVIEKIKTSFHNICDKVKDLLQKKEKITDFLTEKSHVNAFNKIKKEVFILLKRLKPKTVNMKLRFGFDDPATTGQVLGLLSIIYPFLGDTTEISPDFENQVLEGNVYLKGRIRLGHFAALALKLLLNADVRTSYKDIRNFKL